MTIHRATLRRRAYASELASLGLTCREIAIALGISYAVTGAMLRKAGIKPARDKSAWPQADKGRAATMAALYRDGRTLKQIGDQYGLTRERVRQIIHKHFRITRKDGGARKLAAERAARLASKRNSDALAKYGCDLTALKAIREAHGRKPTHAFVQQRVNARLRGIGWELTFWQWWSIWRESGHWERRGRGQGYMMCRHGDTGPYAISNVYIAPGFINSADAQINCGVKKDLTIPTGVRATKSGRFSAHRMVAGKKLCLGTFDTPDLAYAAYLMAAPIETRAA